MEEKKEQHTDAAKEKENEAVQSEERNTAEDKDMKSEDVKTEENDEATELAKQLDEANALNEELKDKLLRLHAEFDNYKKRNLKEKADLIKNGGEKVLESFLPVIDDFERALDVISKSDDHKAIKEGVELIHDKFVGVLHKNGVTEIETAGLALDTDVHEAIAMVPAESEYKGDIS